MTGLKIFNYIISKIQKLQLNISTVLNRFNSIASY